MTRRLFGAVAVLGLGLYLWPALAAPVVRWSDSEADLAWARSGGGIVSPVEETRHTAKPGYLLFLRGAFRLGGERSIVVVQTLLLWGSLVFAAGLFARRRGFGWGAALLVFLLAFLRLRDTASAVMSEALAAALAVALAAVLVPPPQVPLRIVALGAADAFAFFVRPNVGAILLALSVLAMLPRRARAVTALLGGFLVVALPWGLATQGRRSGWRGLDYALAIGGHDYAWALSGGEVPPAGEGWSATLRESGADLRRQLFWRGLHGLLGIEFYDARWSPAYRGLDEAARAASPFVTLLSIAVLSTAKRREPSRRLGLSLLALIVLQSVAIGALPRYALPLLPALFLLALAAAASNDAAAPSRLWPALVVFGLLVAFTRWQHQVVDREGGILESPGARLTQPIPRAALPSRTPATLHIRIGAPLLPTGAGVAIRGPGGATLYETLPGSERRAPFLTVPLPASLLERNRNEPVVLTLEATGSYDANHYLFFPVIPPPWSAPARREGSTELSPVSGVVRGGLDWWAHEGER